MDQLGKDRGWEVLSFDTLNSPELDLSNDAVWNMIFKAVQQGKVAFVWMGPVCSTWSRARHVPLPGGRGPCAAWTPACAYCGGLPPAAWRSRWDCASSSARRGRQGQKAPAASPGPSGTDSAAATRPSPRLRGGRGEGKRG